MNYIKLILLLCLISLGSCDLDLVNPNAATEDDVFNTKDGLIALAVGVQQTYSTSALSTAILTPSVTTRETAIMTTFANLEELEEGASQLSGENGYTSRLFSNIMKSKGMAESLIANIGNVSLDAGTASGLQAMGHLFKAMCLGHLAHNYEQVAIDNNLNNEATFSDRSAALAEAISLLNSAASLLEGTPPSAEFNSSVGNEIDILNTCYAMLSRYNLVAGNYAEAVTAANKVNLNATSVFSYDSQNPNQVYLGMFEGTISYAPRSDFGLPAELAADPLDGRIAFYVDLATAGPSLNNLPVATMVAPFFNSSTADIPLFLPGEVLLNKAEALARLGNISEAETTLNIVRNKTAADDIYGIGANLPDTYSSGGNSDALLNEIYKNRRLECPFIGTSLDDSRRFNRPEPPTVTDLDSERNRNFYPYSDQERLSNPNTPADPPI